MGLFCGCPFTAHRTDCILAASGGGLDTSTYILPPCSRCGDTVYALVGTVCLKCVRSEEETAAATEAVGGTNITFTFKTSWVCGRCQASNAPHMDQCGCAP